MKKKILSLLLVAVMACSIAACGEETVEPNNDKDTEQETNETTGVLDNNLEKTETTETKPEETETVENELSKEELLSLVEESLATWQEKTTRSVKVVTTPTDIHDGIYLLDGENYTVNVSEKLKVEPAREDFDNLGAKFRGSFGVLNYISSGLFNIHDSSILSFDVGDYTLSAQEDILEDVEVLKITLEFDPIPENTQYTYWIDNSEKIILKSMLETVKDDGSSIKIENEFFTDENAKNIE